MVNGPWRVARCRRSSTRRGPGWTSRSGTSSRPGTLREEVNRRAEACAEAVDGKRRQRVRLEEAHDEAHREVRGGGGAERRDERLPADAVPVVAEELRQLQERRGADDRSREQEREPGRVLVREPDEEAAAHRRTGAR